MIIAIMRAGRALPALLMNMETRDSADTPRLLNLCSQLQPWPAVSQSVSQQWTRLPHGHCVETFLQHDQVGNCRIAEDEQTLGEVEGHTRKSSPMNVELEFPTRACLNQRRALVPCVGQTTSTNEWQQQSGGMVLRRGSVVAAFLLCFLAKVCAFMSDWVNQFSRLDVLCFFIFALCVAHCYANITCNRARCKKKKKVSSRAACKFAQSSPIALTVLSSTGVGGDWTIRVANLIDA